jgi:metal transporter CNNM
VSGLTWLAIVACLSQSALLSGLNLGLFSLGRLELQVAATKGDVRAQRVLRLREDANFSLVTILWGNVAVNVLLALLSGSVLTGAAAFLFSTVVITVFAEIGPQAYFSRRALPLAARLAPVLRAYQVLLYPLARPSAWLLDRWLGGEEIRYFRERDLRRVIRLHMEAAASDIGRVEGRGALNFLDLDDVPLRDEGEPVDPRSVLRLDFEGDRPVFPGIEPTPDDPFLRAVQRSGKSWAVIADAAGAPRLVLSTHGFLREALFAPERFNPYPHCHRPILVTEPSTRLGDLIRQFVVHSAAPGDDIVEHDVILLWGDEPRVVTGTDILGRLLRGIARPVSTRTPESMVTEAASRGDAPG